MKGKMKLEVIRGNGDVEVIENNNMVTSIFNKMMYDLFYSESSNTYSPGAIVYYDKVKKLLTLPKVAMYASSGVTNDVSQANPPSVVGMTQGLRGNGICGKSYLVSIVSNSGGGLTINGEFSGIDGNISSVGLCIPSDNNYNSNKSNKVYSRELGYIMNHADYVPYSGGSYTNIVKVGDNPRFFRLKYNEGIQSYVITEDDMYCDYDVTELLGIKIMNTGVNRLPLVPVGDGTYSLIFSGEYVRNDGTTKVDILNVELDSSLLPTGRVVVLGGHGTSYFHKQTDSSGKEIEIVSQVFKCSKIGVGGSSYNLYYDSKINKLRCSKNSYKPLNDTSSVSGTVKDIEVTDIDSDVFKLFNGSYNDDGSYKALGGTVVDVEAVYNSGILPSLEGEDFISSRIELGGGLIFGVINPKNPYDDVRSNVLKDSVNVPIDSLKLMVGRPSSLLTCCSTGGVSVTSKDILRVQYTLLM